jgi:hypothetical protein
MIDLFDDDAGLGQVHPPPAILGWDQRAEIPRLRELTHKRLGVRPTLIEIAPICGWKPRAELTHCRTQRLILLVSTAHINSPFHLVRLVHAGCDECTRRRFNLP